MAKQPAKPKKLTAVKKPPVKKAGDSFGIYKHLTPQHQVAGLRERAAQLEAEHMAQSLRLMEIDAIAEGDDSYTEEMVEEAKTGIRKEIAAIEKRVVLLDNLIDTYEDEESSDE